MNLLSPICGDCPSLSPAPAPADDNRHRAVGRRLSDPSSMRGRPLTSRFVAGRSPNRVQPSTYDAVVRRRRFAVGDAHRHPPEAAPRFDQVRRAVPALIDRPVRSARTSVNLSWAVSPRRAGWWPTSATRSSVRRLFAAADQGRRPGASPAGTSTSLIAVQLTETPVPLSGPQLASFHPAFLPRTPSSGPARQGARTPSDLPLRSAAVRRDPPESASQAGPPTDIDTCVNAGRKLTHLRGADPAIVGRYSGGADNLWSRGDDRMVTNLGGRSAAQRLGQHLQQAWLDGDVYINVHRHDASSM